MEMLNMKFLALVFVFSVLLSMVSTSTIFAFNIDDYLYATETVAAVSNQTATVEGVNYVIFTIAGKNILITKDDTIVQDAGEIEKALKGVTFATSYPSDSELDEVTSFVLKFNESRNYVTDKSGGKHTEDVCQTRTGQGKKPCNDHDSCRSSCYGYLLCRERYMQTFGQMNPFLVDYAFQIKWMNENISIIQSRVDELKAIDSADDITFNVSAKIGELSTAVDDLKEVATNFSSNKLFWPTTGPCSLTYGLCFCPTPALNFTALDTAVSKVTSIKSKAAAFDTISEDAKVILNETLGRIDYFTNVKQKAAQQEMFDALMNEYNNLSVKAAAILTVFSDAKIEEHISNIDSYSEAYYGNISAGNLAVASQQINLITLELSDFSTYLDSVEAMSQNLTAARDKAATNIEKLDILIEETDVTLSAEKADILEEYNALESSVTKKIIYTDAPEVTAKYTTISQKAADLITKKKKTEAERAENVFADIMSGISLGVVDAISEPLGIREDEKRTWMATIPMMILIIADIVILAIVFIVFFFLVWRQTKAFLKKKVLTTWAIIFAVIIVILIGLTFAINTMVAGATGETSIFNFMSHVEAQNETVLFVEYSSADDAATLAAANSCADKITSNITAMNKTVTRKDVVDGVCGELLFAECLRGVGKKPVIRLKIATNGKATFYTFYRAEAILEGDKSYFERCAFVDLMKSDQ